MPEMTEAFIETIAKLKKLAAEQCPDENEAGDQIEDFCAVDWYGSHVDDAFQGGIRAGEIQMARWILSDLNIEW